MNKLNAKTIAAISYSVLNKVLFEKRAASSTIASREIYI